MLVVTASAGWGVAGSWCLRRAAAVELRAAHEVLALGVALVLTGMGLLVALDAFHGLAVGVLLGVGAACALVALGRRAAAGAGPVRARAATLAIGAALAGADLLVARWWTAFSWNPCDDDVAYLYLARRLVLRGDLLDPLDLRRLTSPGGMSALQALFLLRLPDSYLRMADLLIGSLLVLVALWRIPSGRWSAWGIAAAFAVGLFPVAMGMTNSSPVVLPAGLTLAAVLVAVRLRAEAAAPRAELATAAVLGLLLGAVATLRPDYDPPLGVLALAVACWPPLGAGLARRTVGLAAGAGAAVAGWAVASWRAVGTPLFPLLRGNLDPSWPANGPSVAAPAPGALLGRLAGDPLARVWALALLGAVCVAVLLLRGRGAEPARARWSLRLLVIGAGSGAGWVAVLTTVLWAVGGPSVWARYWAPFLLVCLLLPFALLDVRRPAALAGSVALLLLLAPTAVMVTPPLMARLAAAVLADTASGRVGARLAADRYAAVRGEYARAAALVRPGSLVLAAVDVPSLLLADGLDVHSVDVVGSTSPPPHLPYFRGSAAKVRWLRDHGYRYVVAIDPDASTCLYSRDLNARALEGESTAQDATMAPYFLDWFQFLGDLSAMPGATRVGSLLVVPL